MECVAYNAPGGKGVYAVARCCVISGLQCQVHVSPEPGRDAECVDPQHHLTGQSPLQSAVLCVWSLKVHYVTFNSQVISYLFWKLKSSGSSKS